MVGILLLLCVATGCRNNESKNDGPKGDGGKKPKVGATKTPVPGKAVSLPSFISVEQLPIQLEETAFQTGKQQGHFAMPETIGGGLALFDYDCNGVLDIVVSGGGALHVSESSVNGASGALLRANGHGGYSSCSNHACLDFSATYNEAVVSCDYNGDGFMDVLVTGFSALQLYRNQGDGTFEEVHQEAGLDDQLWSSGAAFFDADSDGDLDLYVVHYANWAFNNNLECFSSHASKKRDYCGPRDFTGLPDTLYENLGDGTFRDITATAGLTTASRGLGIIAADLDDDNDVDIYVANDVAENFLYRNQGKLSFSEVGVRSGTACDDLGRPEGSMGIALGDYNLDGRFDLFVTNYEAEVCALYRNEGKLSFTYASRLAKITMLDEQSVSWGTAFNDLDLDGDEDLIVINGHLESYSENSPYQQLPQPIENVEGKYFRIARENAGTFFNTPQSGRGLAMGDLDGDGLVDFGVTRLDQPLALLRNTSKAQGDFVSVRLVGIQSNREAIGAKLTLTSGSKKQVRQVVGGGSYSSSSDRAVHFGVPKDKENAPCQLSIRWPSGLEKTVTVERNSTLLVVEGQE